MSKPPIKNIIFFGGKPTSGRCLERLYEFHNEGKVNIAGVVTRRKGETGWWSKPGVEEIRETAERLGLKIISQEECLFIPADIGISLLYFRIFPKEIIDHFTNGIINFHPAPLPYYRGANAISHSLLKGETRFGASIHFVDEGVDTGEVIDVKWFDVSELYTARGVMEKVELTVENMFNKWLDRIISNQLPSTPQSDICEKLGIIPEYHSRKSLDKARLLELGWSAEKIYNHVRALDFPPFEPAYILIKGRKVYLRISF